LLPPPSAQNRRERSVDSPAPIFSNAPVSSAAPTPSRDSLSLLERKRLELARAMATDPKLLLLDEIAGGLTEGECLRSSPPSAQIHAKGTTIIWIEHVLHALTSVVERLLVLDFGRVIGIGALPRSWLARGARKSIWGSRSDGAALHPWPHRPLRPVPGPVRRRYHASTSRRVHRHHRCQRRRQDDADALASPASLRNAPRAIHYRGEAIGALAAR
jgi:energy-coupling factor transporter ATP-binding protein EcfA2